MSTPLPPDLAQLERALEATRAGLPADLRARVLGAAGQARTLAAGQTRPRELALSTGWFAAAVAVAAALLLNVSSSAAIFPGEGPGGEPDRCAASRALHEAPELCR